MAVQLTQLNSKFIQGEEGANRSLLILVHGRGGRLKLMEWFSKRIRIAGLDYLLLEAPIPEDVKEMKEPGFSWYLMPRHEGISETREKISKSLKEIIASGYPSEKVFWLGFSQGGVMGLDTGLRGDFSLGGIICISGFSILNNEYPEAFGPMAMKQKFLATHGRRDEIVPFDKALKTYEELQRFGINLEFEEFNKPHSFDLKNEIPFLKEKLESWINP